MPAPRRVAILGGGIAGLAAAWELSRPEHRDAVGPITVYQRGWRLGGKGASSRGEHGRIEEHGLHVWLGYYENAFRLVRETYGELDRPRTDPACPIAGWQDAFRPASSIGLGELHDGEWLHWLARFNENRELPGEPDADRTPLTPAELVQRALRLLGDFGNSLFVDAGSTGEPTVASPLVLSTNPIPPRPSSHSPESRGRVGLLTRDAVLVAALEAISAMSSVVSSREPLDGAASAFSLSSVEIVVTRLRASLAERVRGDDATRRMWHFLDLVRAIVRGIVADGLMTRPEGYAAVDDEDYRDWLTRHGAGPETIESPLVRVVYDLVFGYEHGDAERPRFAAGTGLLLSGKMFFDYRGAVFWKMTAGMGDVVFAPLYDALRARGVEFRFFHRVDRLGLSPDGQRIDAVDMGVQATLADGVDTYEPLVDVGGLPCWPAAPCHDQLVDSSGYRPDDFESHWSRMPDVGTVSLRAGRDFDAVVLAIPVGMHRAICGELIANPRTPEWREMTDHLGTVATRSMQLWLRVSEAALGWKMPDVTVSGYPGAFHTYAAMSELLATEAWPPGNRPASIGYFCHVHETIEPPPADDVEYPVREHARVRDDAIEFLRHDVCNLWPRAARDGDFRWDLLCGNDGDTADDETRLDGQYLRANVDPSDRYVLSLPGTGRYRLRADESGYGNLALAGDWIDSSLNAGCIEAAVVSGIQAANAVLGRHLLEGVAGYYQTHQARGDRAWVEASVPTTSARP